MGAFTHPVGIRIVDEFALEVGFNDVTERMLYHSVVKGCSRDEALTLYVTVV